MIGIYFIIAGVIWFVGSIVAVYAEGGDIDESLQTIYIMVPVAMLWILAIPVLLILVIVKVLKGEL